MNKYVDLLNNDPIFIMSLSSKELFHSNFWSWLFERNIEYIRVFFPELQSFDKVYREQGNRDITIWQGQDSYVIENKFKALPELTQLKKYQKKLNEQFKSGIITGIIKPSFTDSETDWLFISYEEIGEKIKKVAYKIENDCFEKEFIINYANMIIRLAKCIKQLYDEYSGKWIFQNEYKEIEKLRIDDVLKKLKADELRKYLNDELGKYIPTQIGKYELTVRTYFSNNKPGVDIFYEQKEKLEEIYGIGIQIEGLQYRWIVHFDKDSKKSIQDIYKEYKKYDWFIDYEKNKDSNIIREHFTSLSKKYCKYNNNFLYQYWNIQDGEPFEILKNQVIIDMKRASEILF